jgi:hypothetical protein
MPARTASRLRQVFQKGGYKRLGRHRTNVLTNEPVCDFLRAQRAFRLLRPNVAIGLAPERRAPGESDGSEIGSSDRSLMGAPSVRAMNDIKKKRSQGDSANRKGITVYRE